MSGRESNHSCLPTAEIKGAHSTTLSSRVESSRVESSRVRLTHTRQRILVLLWPLAERVHTSRVESSPKILDESRAFMSHVSFFSVGFLEPGVTVAVFRYEINLEMSVLLVEGHQIT
jgi:hypothetical protein